MLIARWARRARGHASGREVPIGDSISPRGAVMSHVASIAGAPTRSTPGRGRWSGPRAPVDASAQHVQRRTALTGSSSQDVAGSSSAPGGLQQQQQQQQRQQQNQEGQAEQEQLLRKSTVPDNRDTQVSRKRGCAPSFSATLCCTPRPTVGGGCDYVHQWQGATI